MASGVIRWVKNVLLAISQLGNAVTGGDPDMSLSGRMGRAIGQGRCVLCRPVCALLHLIERDHCAKAAANEADEGVDEVLRL